MLSLRRIADTVSQSCGEIIITDNVFTKNIGCSETNGVAYIYCKNSQSLYTASTDSWYTPELTQITPLNGIVGVTLSSNSIETNFAGTNRSIIEVSGFPMVTFSKNIIQNNENWLPTSFKNFSPIFPLQSD